jgi:inosose dehydratase
MTSPNPFTARPARAAGLNRREFLSTTALAATAMGCRATAAPAPSTPGLVGTQLYGWGQYYQREGKDLFRNLDEALSAIRDCGFAYAEGYVDTNDPANNAAYAERLRSKGMQPVSLYTGGRLHEQPAADTTVEKLLAAAKVCQAAGFRVIVCNPDPIGREKSDAELRIQVDALKRLGGGLRELGLRLGIHHHTPEMANKGREYHFNFRNSPVGTVGFCYDVHWVFRGGIEPADALSEYGARVVTWHLRQSRERIWWEDLATGDIDYTAIARHARMHALAPLYTVELAIENGTKITRTVVENHKRSREFVRQTFGV